MSKPMSSVTFRALLSWEVLCCRLFPRRHWWDEIDDGVILGALPSATHIKQLQRLGVRAVVNMCAEYEGCRSVYAQHEMQSLRLATIDMHPPSYSNVCRAIAFISQHRDNGNAVYIHCRAGRGRAATIALCWLIKSHSLIPENAYAHLHERRVQIDRGLAQREVVKRFWTDQIKV